MTRHFAADLATGLASPAAPMAVPAPPANGPAGQGAPDWFELDLFPRTTARSGPRFDDTVAHPVDAPRRLDAVIAAAGLRLRALPDATDVGQRTVVHRAHLEEIRRAAVRARVSLAAGTYGTCRTCAEPISLARLTERPWVQLCVYCDLDI